MSETISLARETGCDRLCFSPIVDFAEPNLSQFVPAEPEKRRLRKSLKDIKKQLDALCIDNNVDTMLLHYSWDGRIYDTLPCYPAWYFTYIRSDGRVFACQRNTSRTTPLGDLNTNRFRDIWNNDAYRSFRKTASTCEGLSSIREYYCDYCSHSMNSQRVHRRFRFIAPLKRMISPKSRIGA